MFQELLVKQDAAQEARQAASILQTRERDVEKKMAFVTSRWAAAHHEDYNHYFSFSFVAFIQSTYYRALALVLQFQLLKLESYLVT